MAKQAKIGLSPRVRGNPSSRATCTGMTRSIPACAGEPETDVLKILTFRVYPRVCGGTSLSADWGLDGKGLSPRVRGNRLPMPSWMKLETVYPRVCGGTPFARPSPIKARGLSPRVRGNQRPLPAARSSRRSIPACAGEPPLSVTMWALEQVYPRVCGGTGALGIGNFEHRGLSPRVRGNQPGQSRFLPQEGSIPACAGEPASTPWQGRSAAVYPRVCGEPWGRPSIAGSSGVYPRVCGGTRAGLAAKGSLRGLSPRVRGNPQAAAGVIF